MGGGEEEAGELAGGRGRPRRSRNNRSPDGMGEEVEEEGEEEEEEEVECRDGREIIAVVISLNEAMYAKPAEKP